MISISYRRITRADMYITEGKAYADSYEFERAKQVDMNDFVLSYKYLWLRLLPPATITNTILQHDNSEQKIEKIIFVR